MKINKKLFGYIFLGTLLAASIFGLAGINHTNMNCDQSFPDQACPPMLWGIAIHYLSTYSNLMSAIILPITSSLISIILILLAAFTIVRFLIAREVSPPTQFPKQNFLIPNIFQKIKLHSWLSLFENSPSFI